MPVVVGRDPCTHRDIAVQVEGECITAVTERSSNEATCWIAPGLVDLQVNGYRGVDLNARPLAVAEVLRLTRMLAAEGTTRYFPTIITGNEEAMTARLRAVADARALDVEVRYATPGIHLEGPWISPLDGYRGAHPRGDVRAPSLEEFDIFQAAADGAIRIVTLSPHWPECDALIRELTARGVVVAIGHTHAGEEQIDAAVRAGATLSTHLGNGIAETLPRHPNPLWAQLAHDALQATFIADGVHLSAATLRVMLRAKTTERAILVSDSVALAGSAAGAYRSDVGGAVMVQADGTIRMRDSQLLAGSGITLKDAVARTPGLTGCTLAEAVRMATQNPAAALGLGMRTIRAGNPADLLTFRWDEDAGQIEVIDVMVRGTRLDI